MYRPALSVELPILSLEFLDFNEHVYDFIDFSYNNIRSRPALLDWNGIFNGFYT